MRGLQDRLKDGPVHITLIDPDKQGPSAAASVARSSEEGGTRIVLVGGTTGVDQEKLDGTLAAVRDAVQVPVVIFPAASEVISGNADAIFFMSLMNSRDVRFVVGEAARAALPITKLGIEAIPVGYLVFAPGMLVGRIGDVELLSREDPMRAMEYARACQLFGMDLCYLEGGSGVSAPLPGSVIRAIRSVIDIPLVVGGGIRTPEQAGEAVLAGAEIVVTGTMLEREADVASTVRKVVDEMQLAWAQRKAGSC